MRRPATVLLITAGLAGCGDGDEDKGGRGALPKAEFVRQADALCKDFRGRANAVAGSTPADARKLRGLVEDFLERVERLGPPAQQRAALDSYLAGMRKNVPILRRLEAALADGDRPAVERVRVEVRANDATVGEHAEHYGFRVCGGQDGGRGTGYTVELPDGWKDQTDQAAGSAIRLDRLLAGPAARGFTTNINVIRETPRGVTDVRAATRGVRRQLATIGATQISQGKDVTLDEERALTFDYRLGRGGVRLRGRQAFAVHDRAIYTVTYTARAEAFGASADAFADVLRSWRWST